MQVPSGCPAAISFFDRFLVWNLGGDSTSGFDELNKELDGFRVPLTLENFAHLLYMIQKSWSRFKRMTYIKKRRMKRNDRDIKSLLQ